MRADTEADIRYGAALGLLLVAYVIQASSSRLVDAAVALTFGATLALVLFDRETPSRLRALGLAVAVPSILISVAAGVFDLGDTWRGVGSFGTALVLFVTVIALLSRISRHDQITTSTVMGAVMAYALLAFAAGAVYWGVELVTDEPFFAQGVTPRADFIYFSFVTLTTLGFGDLTPGIDLAKRLVVLETFVGQVFLVVLVARLVSMWGLSRPRWRAEQDD